MPKRDWEDKDDEDDEDDDFESPFDFFKVIDNELFKTEDFQRIFREVYKKISEFLPQNFQIYSTAYRILCKAFPC